MRGKEMEFEVKIPDTEFHLWDDVMRMSHTPILERVIYNPPATIALWDDGTKTVVKSQNEIFDAEKGLAMAIVKRLYGNRGDYNKLFTHNLPTVDEHCKISDYNNRRILDKRYRKGI